MYKLTAAGLRGLTGRANPQNQNEIAAVVPSERGYLLGDRRLSGRAALNSSSFGYEIVLRIKDTRPLLLDEIEFWAGLLAQLVTWTVDVVTHAPSSGKVPDDEHLATILGGYVGEKLGIPCQHLYTNTNPRGTKGSRVTKLNERHENPFAYTGLGNGSRLLVVDDVVYTRSTAIRCQEAAISAGDSATFVVLYRA